MLFRNPNFIFIHVPKTGGSTFSSQFRHTGTLLGDDVFIHDPDFHNHDTLQMYVDKGINISEYTIVTIARNPWDRILSFYCYQYAILKPHAFTFASLWPPMFGKGCPTYISFPDFYNNIEPSFRFIEDFMDFITIDGNVPDNLTILDFENYREEIEKYCDTHDIVISGDKEHFPHDRDNKKLSKNIREYFLSDPAFIEKISVQYSKEIEYFDYKPPKLYYNL